MATQLSTALPQAINNTEKMSNIRESRFCGWAGNLLVMAELRKKILTYRDIIDLPSCDGSCPMIELVMGTVDDLRKLYPSVVLCNLASESEETSLNQALCYLYGALKSISDLWMKNHRWIADSGDETESKMESVNLEQPSQRVLTMLNHSISIARKIFEVMEEDDNEMSSQSYSNKKITCPSPDTPTAFSPDIAFSMELGQFANTLYSSPLLMPLRIQAMQKLQPVEMKHLPFCRPPLNSSRGCSPMKQINQMVDQTKDEKKDAFLETPAKLSNERLSVSTGSDKLTKNPNSSSHVMSEAKESAAVPNPPPPPAQTFPTRTPVAPLPPSNLSGNGTSALPPPPPPPAFPSKGAVPQLPIPTPLARGAAPPPPPPVGATRVLRPKKCTKLKRSNHMGNLYRLLKGKVEGSSLNGKSTRGRKIGGSSGGKQGMADALAEITRRSTYFQQIDEDVRKHAKLIMQIQASINSFQTKDMSELLKFHKYIEQHLEKLTDETQVLAKFEGFPTKKLESLRAAAALYSKLEEIANNLQNWKVTPPICKHLDKVDSYFNKIKGEIDGLERSKDEESKRFQSNGIHFDFNILVRIKELMVDVSSNCMELALKERRERNAAESAEKNQSKACTKTLWRAFQLAFRVYSFAGGQDDRADTLTKEVAHEIETDPESAL